MACSVNLDQNILSLSDIELFTVIVIRFIDDIVDTHQVLTSLDATDVLYLLLYAC